MQQNLEMEKKPEFKEIEDKDVQTVIETDTEVTGSHVNVELSEKTVTTTKKREIIEGEKKTVIDMDETEKVQEISYPKLNNVYRKSTAEKKRQKDESKSETVQDNAQNSQPVVVLRLKIPELESNHEVPETVDLSEAEPSFPQQKNKDETGEFLEEIPENRDFISFLEGRTTEAEAEETTREYIEQELEVRQETEEELKIPEPRIESEKSLEEYELEPLSQEEINFSEGQPATVQPPIVNSLMKDFEGLENYSLVGRNVVRARYDPVESEKGVSERIIVSLDTITEGEKVEGSEVVEYLGSETDIDATVAEIPYYSENSGASWASGWNSFDMVLQMGEMDFQEMEYLVSEPGETRDKPGARSIGSEFESSKNMEFRESQEWSTHDEGYTASEETRKAWQERYGEGIMQLDSIERGIYAAIVEDKDFRGSEIEFSDLNLQNGDFLEKVYESRKDYRDQFTLEKGGRELSKALS